MLRNTVIHCHSIDSYHHNVLTLQSRPVNSNQCSSININRIHGMIADLESWHQDLSLYIAFVFIKRKNWSRKLQTRVFSTGQRIGNKDASAIKNGAGICHSAALQCWLILRFGFSLYLSLLLTLPTHATNCIIILLGAAEMMWWPHIWSVCGV